jgi:hypothetical protein
LCSFGYAAGGFAGLNVADTGATGAAGGTVVCVLLNFGSGWNNLSNGNDHRFIVSSQDD